MDWDTDSDRFERGRIVAILCILLLAGLVAWAWLGDAPTVVEGLLDWLQASSRGHS